MARRCRTPLNALVPLALALSAGCQPTPPYPPSELVREIQWHFLERIEFAAGSDNWAMTWAGPGVHYATWGDGGGYGGNDRLGRVSLGVARIEGSSEHFTVSNVWGGVNAEAEATFGGKSYGILAVPDQLWMWVSPGSNAEGYREARLAVSEDEGRSWSRVDWAFTAKDRIVFPAFLQTGPGDYDGSGAPLNTTTFVHAYFVELQGDPDGLRVQRPGRIHLARAPVAAMGERSGWQFHAGPDSTGTVRWADVVGESQPVFEDLEGVGWCVSVSYHAGLQRYVLTTEHQDSFAGRLGVFEAPNPWGPWSTIEYSQGWGPERRPRQWFYGNIAPGWSRGDSFIFVATGVGACDRWMSVRGTFVRRTAPDE